MHDAFSVRWRIQRHLTSRPQDGAGNSGPNCNTLCNTQPVQGNGEICGWAHSFWFGTLYHPLSFKKNLKCRFIFSQILPQVPLRKHRSRWTNHPNWTIVSTSISPDLCYFVRITPDLSWGKPSVINPTTIGLYPKSRIVESLFAGFCFFMLIIITE